MNTPKDIRIQDYSYELPDEKIAKFPLSERDASKLLQYKDGLISDHSFREISTLLPTDSLILFNNTKVIHARLLFQRETGAQIEVFCIEPADHLDYQLTFASKQSCSWKCMVGNAKRWKDGEVLRKIITTPSGDIELSVTKNGKSGELFLVNFNWNNQQLSFAEVLHHAGILPLPPYLNRDTEESDEERYQTVYAKVQGSVAAPTAGLHFTDAVLEALSVKNITIDEVTLHVGAGTFKPIKSDTLAEHEMHEETIFVYLNTLKNIARNLEQGKPLITVGTTSTRTLESLYWHGVKVLHHGADETVSIKQWDAYETQTFDTTSLQAIQAIINNLEQKNLSSLQGSTQIIIAPGYSFRLVDILVTNFHQPENTLILLIAAFVGKDWKRIYEHALSNDYRFLSYGDSSVLWRTP
ncbi:MAG: S-adenosylmethionine:tRNA ribosyltransferase-isomerase [Bacteroidota bacterium]